jgi:hypothetical protein
MAVISTTGSFDIVNNSETSAKVILNHDKHS